jgi:hypothetical protein
MKNLLLLLLAIGAATLAGARPVIIYTEKDFVEGAKAYLRAQPVAADHVALLLVSLVSNEAPQVTLLKAWSPRELEAGVKFDSSSDGVEFRGELVRTAEAPESSGVARLRGDIFLEIATVVRAGTEIPGARIEWKINNTLRLRTLMTSGDSAREKNGIKMGASLVLVRGG